MLADLSRLRILQSQARLANSDHSPSFQTGPPHHYNDQTAKLNSTMHGMKTLDILLPALVLDMSKLELTL